MWTTKKVEIEIGFQYAHPLLKKCGKRFSLLLCVVWLIFCGDLNQSQQTPWVPVNAFGSLFKDSAQKWFLPQKAFLVCREEEHWRHFVLAPVAVGLCVRSEQLQTFCLILALKNISYSVGTLARFSLWINFGEPGYLWALRLNSPYSRLEQSVTCLYFTCYNVVSKAVFSTRLVVSWMITASCWRS